MMVAEFADSSGRERNFLQQMRWTLSGAQLLQVRVQALNDDLPAVLQRWYPDLGHCREEKLTA
jgi:hypothetical protein